MMEDCPVKEMCKIYDNAPEDCNEDCEDYNLWLKNSKLKIQGNNNAGIR